MLAPWKENCYKSRQLIKKQRHHFAKKGQSYIFSISHAQMNMGDEEGWAPKNWCFQTVVLEKTLENPLDSKKFKPVNLKGNQSWLFLEELMLKLKFQYFGILMQKANSWKRPWCGKDWRQKKRAAEDEMVRKNHWLNEHEFEQTLGDSEGQGSLSYYSPWGHKELDVTEQLNNKYAIPILCIALYAYVSSYI